MQKTMEDFIRENASEKDSCAKYYVYSKEIQKMLKNLYSCCFRFCLYKGQTLFVLNKALEPFEQKDDLFDL